MACLAFGRGGLPAAPPPLPSEDGLPPPRQLVVPDDPAKAQQEAAVFDALAHQATAFVCNLDEATVNCGAAQPHTIHLSSSSGGSSGQGGSARGGSPAHDPACSSSSAACGPTLFRRLRAAAPGAAHCGWGWRDARAAFELAMRQENRVERMVARTDSAAAEKRLLQRLLVARLEAAAFKGCAGGDALFEALALAVWGTPLLAPHLRAPAVAYAAAHPEEYRCFLGDDWDAYLSCMSRGGVPGDELMLRALGDHFGLPINIVTSDAFMWFQRYAPVRARTLREVTLAFLGPSTWMPVRRQSAMAALKLTLTGSSDLRVAREVRRKMQQLEAQQQPGVPPGAPMGY